MATAIEAMQLGAYEYLVSPLELDTLTGLIKRRWDRGPSQSAVQAVIPEASVADDATDTLLGNSECWWIRSPGHKDPPSCCLGLRRPPIDRM